MRDELRFSAPWGPFGHLAAKIVVRRYLTTFLMRRNTLIKQVAESEEWHTYLDGQPEIKQASHADGGQLTRREGMLTYVGKAD